MSPDAGARTTLLGRYETRFERIRFSLNHSYHAGFDPVARRKVALHTGPAYLFDENLRRVLGVAMTLAHPHLVNVIDHGLSQRDCFVGDDYGSTSPGYLVVAEAFDGQTLRDTLKARSPLPEAEVSRIMAAILSGATCLHDNRMKIGTITPDRILLTAGGDVRLFHPLIAEEYFIDGPRLVDRSRMLHEPPLSEMSESAAPAAWCYSLGIMLHTMLTGMEPGQYRVPDQKFRICFAHNPPPPPSGIAPVDPAFDAVVAKATAERPDGRFATPAAFAAALAAIGREPPR